MSDSRNMVSTTTGGNGEEKTTSSIAIKHSTDNTGIPILYTLFNSPKAFGEF